MAVDVTFIPAGIRGTNAGYDFLWDNTTSDDDPGAGSLGWNHATISSATAIFINDSEVGTTDIQADVNTWDDGSSTITGMITVVDKADSTIFARFNVTGAVTSNSGYSTIVVTHSVSAGAFTNDGEISVQFTRTGNKGDTGLTGATGAAGTDAGVAFTFNSAQSDSDKDSGDIWYNAVVGSATVIYVDNNDSNAVDVQSITDSWDDSTNTAHYGTLKIVQDSDQSNWAVFSVTGTTVDASGYSKLSVTYVADNGTISDNDAVWVQFSRTGNLGATGAAGSDGEATNGFVIAMAVAL
jgi:hypothetical protein